MRKMLVLALTAMMVVIGADTYAGTAKEPQRKFVLQLGHQGSIEHLVFSPDGATLVTAGGDGDKSVKFWDVPSGALLATFHLTGWPQSLSYSSLGKYVAAGDLMGWTYVWDTQRLSESGRIKPDDAGSPPQKAQVSFLPDGLLTVSHRQAKLWDPQTMKVVRETKLFGTHSPKGNLLFKFDAMLEMPSERVLWRTKPPRYQAIAAFSPDESVVATADSGTTAAVYDARTGAMLWNRRIAGAGGTPVVLG